MVKAVKSLTFLITWTTLSIFTVRAQSDTLYAFRLSLLPHAMDIEFNQNVKKHLQPLLKNEKDSTARALAIFRHYQPMIDSVFKTYGLPAELVYAFCSFSGGSLAFRQNSGQTGAWMMDFQAARSMGLRITSFIDERRDPVLSTIAFARYMSELNRIYNDWNLSYAAYISGVTEVNNALRNAEKGKMDFAGIRNYLSPLAAESIDRLTAWIYIGNYYKSHGITPSHPFLSIAMSDTTVQKWVNLRQWADSANVDIALLRFHNPTYFRGTIPLEKKALLLRWPWDKFYVLPKLDSLEYSLHGTSAGRSSSGDLSGGPAESSTFIRHKVKSGETISGIARKYGCTVDDIKRWNRLKKNTLQAGQVLRIQRKTRVAPKPATPADTAMSEKKPEHEKKPESEQLIVYTVKSGDTLGKIAARYGVTVAQIKQWNNLKNDNIAVGKKLKILK